MNGIIGCKALRPLSKHMNKVLAVNYFYSSVPIINIGFVASRYTSHKSYCQNEWKELAASPNE
jgi:hypothetical protein